MYLQIQPPSHLFCVRALPRKCPFVSFFSLSLYLFFFLLPLLFGRHTVVRDVSSAIAADVVDTDDGGGGGEIGEEGDDDVCLYLRAEIAYLKETREKVTTTTSKKQAKKSERNVKKT